MGRAVSEDGQSASDNKVKSKEGKRRNGFAIIFLFTSKIKTYYNTFSLFEERIYYLNAFS